MFSLYHDGSIRSTLHDTVLSDHTLEASHISHETPLTLRLGDLGGSLHELSQRLAQLADKVAVEV